MDFKNPKVIYSLYLQESVIKFDNIDTMGIISPNFESVTNYVNSHYKEVKPGKTFREAFEKALRELRPSIDPRFT